MSLADELLADLEENGELDVNKPDRTADEATTDSMELEETPNILEPPPVLELESVVEIWGSKRLEKIMKEIDKSEEIASTPEANEISLEDRDEYAYIVDSNQLAVEIENEIVIIYKFIRDLYAIKFPELESLVTNPMEYIRAVKTIGNERDPTKIDAELREFLKSATVMVINVTLTTAPGKDLDQEKLKEVFRACDICIDLENCRQRITNYVSSRMSMFAPNVSAIVGTKTAAQLIGVAGGLLGLSRVPSCNVTSLGASRRILYGLSASNMAIRNGYIWGADLVIRTPSELKNKAVKFAAAKVVLAARVDSAHESPDGSIGKKFRKDIDKKMEKLMEPPPNREVKALAVPASAPKKRRGGRRMRKYKEKFATTEIQKLQNRAAFGVAEEEILVGDEFEGLGLAGKSAASGKVRASATDTRTKVKLKSKNNSSHLASETPALDFTAAQGIELANPNKSSLDIKKSIQKGSKWFVKD